MKRAQRRADAAIRLIDELLSSRKLQRSTRSKLLELRRELQELSKERDVGKRDLGLLALQWAAIAARLYEILDLFFK
jgi:ATP-dependent Clp protease ATP-binding subunit ClpA